MIYAEILAGGKGSRMGNVPLPKQFLNLGGSPIIIQTIGKFLLQMDFKVIIVVVSKKWVHYTNDLIKKYFRKNQLKRIIVTEGGNTRNDTLIKGIKFIENRFGINDDDVIVTHDAVRPFVSQRILHENITAVLKYGSVDTVIPAIDTIVKSDKSSEYIDSIPERPLMFQGQTPQSFNMKLLLEAYTSLTEDERDVLTDAAKIILLSKSKKNKVKLVYGEQQNFKITTSFDLRMAESLVQERGE